MISVIFTIRGELRQIIIQASSEKLPKTGSEWMAGDLNVGPPTAVDNAVNKLEYVDTEILEVDTSGTLLLDGSNKLR